METQIVLHHHNDFITHGKTARGASSPATDYVTRNEIFPRESEGVLTAGFAHARTVVDNLHTMTDR
jgi:hypothetical protein